MLQEVHNSPCGETTRKTTDTKEGAARQPHAAVSLNVPAAASLKVTAQETLSTIKTTWLSCS